MEDLPSLTVKEKALIHIYLQKSPGWAIEYPESLTQKGIAEEIGVSRAHVAQCLISLEKEGKINSKKSRVANHDRKLKTYRLLEPGRKKAKKLYEDLIGCRIELMNKDESEKIPFGKLMERYDLSFFELYGHCKDDDLEKLEEDDDTEEEVQETEESHTPSPSGNFEYSSTTKRTEETVPEEEGYAKAVIGLLLLFSIPFSFLFVFKTGSEILCLYPLLSLIAGLALMASYFSRLDERNKWVEQIFSFSILVNSFFVLWVLYSGRYYDFLEGGDLSTYFFVLLSIFLAIFFTHESDSEIIKGLPYIFGSFLIAYGIISTLLVDHNFTSSIGLLWILGGAFVLDTGVRWNEDIRWYNYISFGLGSFIVIWLIILIIQQKMPLKLTIIVILWISLVVSLFFLYVIRAEREKREQLTMRLWNAVPIILGAVFAFIAVLLFMSEQYIEGAVELGLGVLFLIELFKGDIDLKESIFWGLPLALLSVLTIAVLILY